MLDGLVATAEGRADVDFWRTFFKQEDGSGATWVGGWINVLFPYFRPKEPDARVHEAGALVRNDRMAAWKGVRDAAGPTKPAL